MSCPKFYMSNSLSIFMFFRGLEKSVNSYVHIVRLVTKFLQGRTMTTATILSHVLRIFIPWIQLSIHVWGFSYKKTDLRKYSYLHVYTINSMFFLGHSSSSASSSNKSSDSSLRMPVTRCEMSVMLRLGSARRQNTHLAPPPSEFEESISE